VSEKTYHTAVVLIPPEECWQPIQAIRRVHDRHVDRWMPHITLLYPFRPRELFDASVAPLQAAAAEIEPFEIILRELRHFRHGRGSYTIWLAPEPVDELKRLQTALQAAVPECDDASRYSGGFRPHLSIGQVRDAAALEALSTSLQQSWEPLKFTASRVSLIWRADPPDDVFRVDRQIALGQS